MSESLTFLPEYPSCRRCYATLAFYSLSDDPAVVSKKLGVAATRMLYRDKNRKLNSWLLTSESDVDSKDIREHIFWICSRLENNHLALKEVQESWQNKLHCFWESETGNGGPLLDARFLTYIANYNLDIHFDIWFPE